METIWNDIAPSSLPLFGSLPPALIELITPSLVKTYQDGDPILHQGDEADALIVLLHGQARILVGETHLVTRVPYAILGEQAFINGTERSATVVAQGMVKALRLPRHLVEHLMLDPTFLRNLLGLVSDKLAEATRERAIRYRQEQLLYAEFRGHVSDEVLQRLLNSGRSYGDPQHIDAVILFSDIRAFTQRSAGMTADEIAAELSPYLDAVVDVIHQHEGMVDKFVGDAVMAIWGFAPSENPPAEQAFRCAQAVVATAAGMSFGGEPIAIGVGLNAGQVFIGNVGGEGKRQFTVLGTPVNLASRFEAQSKELGSPIVLGQALYDALPEPLQAGLACHRDQHIKGAAPQTLYTVAPFGFAGSDHQ